MTFLITYLIEVFLVKLAMWTTLFCVSCFIVGSTIALYFLRMLLSGDDND